MLGDYIKDHGTDCKQIAWMELGDFARYVIKVLVSHILDSIILSLVVVLFPGVAGMHRYMILTKMSVRYCGCSRPMKRRKHTFIWNLS